MAVDAYQTEKQAESSLPCPTPSPNTPTYLFIGCVSCKHDGILLSIPRLEVGFVLLQNSTARHNTTQSNMTVQSNMTRTQPDMTSSPSVTATAGAARLSAGQARSNTANDNKRRGAGW